ncbi:hypothetical protein CRYUN_Cryun01aG0072100 [Craigia yunnanensis]
MLGVLCARPPKPWILNSLSLIVHGGSAAHHQDSRLVHWPIHFADLSADNRRCRHHSTACRLGGSDGGAASIWHAILPCGGGGGRRREEVWKNVERKGEGSWNVAWDARPARWLHRPVSAWLLFGVCDCLEPMIGFVDSTSDADDKIEDADLNLINCFRADEKSSISSSADADNYKVTGVLADGRCLFRAIAHGACLRSGEEAPDENRQRELADELRAQVVNELLKRREETEWFIEGDFDAYVKEIQQPYVWGGEPELLMASHVLKTPILVYMIHRSSGNLVNIANYGEEYQKDKENPINVLFHRYGHYDILESMPEQNCHQVNT